MPGIKRPVRMVEGTISMADDDDKSTNDPAGCLASLKTAQRMFMRSAEARLDSHSDRLIKAEDTLRGKNDNAGLVGKVEAVIKAVKDLKTDMEKAIADFKTEAQATRKEFIDQSQATRTSLGRWAGGLIVAILALTVSNFIR